MAQHDYDIANQSGANFRADLNNALDAIVSNNSGSSEPSTTFAYEWWIDTSANVLKLRNSANNAWITLPLSITADNSTSGALTVNGNLSTTGTLDVNGGEVILDADADTSITADTDDQIDFRVGAVDVMTLTNSHLVLKGTTPKITIGDGGEEDTALIFDGNAQDFYIGLDDSADDLLIGTGSTVGSNAKVVIENGGKVGIGTVTPSFQLEVVNAHEPDGSGIFANDATQLQIKNSSTTDGASAGMIYCSGAGAGVITASIFPNADSTREAHYVFASADVNGNFSERVRLTSDGSFNVGGTTAFGADTITLGQGGFMGIRQTGAEAMELRRDSTDGRILEFRKDGTLVGSVSTNTHSLPSDRNFKRDITDLNLGLNLITKLKPSQYNYKVNDENSPKMFGLIAQDLEESLEEVGVEKNSTWLLQHEPNKNENESDYSLDYQKLIPILINSIKELEARIKTLEE